MQRLSRLGSSWPRRGRDLLRNQGVLSLEGVTPLFECKPPLSSRWTWPLVITQLLVSVVGVELVFNHWTRPVESADKKPEAASTGTPSTTTNPETEYELRPLWHRLSLAALQSGASAAVCYVLFQSRARTLRRLYVLPSQSLAHDAPFLPSLHKRHNRVLVMQNVWQWRAQGMVVPFAGNVNLERGARDLELTLNFPNHGRYTLPLGDAKVNGENYDSLYKLKEALYTAWYGPQKSVRELAKLGWQPE